MIQLSDFMKWTPDAISEDRVSMIVLRTLIEEDWALAYYNPPSGSWKGLALRYAGHEYRQIGPKRGIRQMKRPDIAFQDLTVPDQAPRFLLFENKKRRTDWQVELPDLLEAYFEHPTEGVRRLPFDHRRRLEKGSKWERLWKDNPDRNWFTNITPTYIFGFAYGPVLPDRLEGERLWIETELQRLTHSKPPLDVPASSPPIVFVAIAVEGSSMQPKFARGYSNTFPNDVRVRLEQLFEAASPEA